MSIHAVDQDGKTIATIALDLEGILNLSSGTGNEFFGEATRLVKAAVEDKIPQYQIANGNDAAIEAYLRSFAASGDTTPDVKISVYHRQGSGVNLGTHDVFDEVVEFPHDQHRMRYGQLVGLDDLKEHIHKEAALILDPTSLRGWSLKIHRKPVDALSAFRERYPFFIFEGDVGTGKTEFAETFGDAVARYINKPLWLARISLKSRGDGIVGDMSSRITRTFQEALDLARRTRTPGILLLDEADALAQSRSEAQMHHEDRAGVNALIQGVDRTRYSDTPIIIVFCTNRYNAIDPALKRRASVIRHFDRPNDAQRMALLQRYFGDLGLRPFELDRLVAVTGANGQRGHGFTYSDLVTRLVPQAVLQAYPTDPLTFELIYHVATEMEPTPQFDDSLR